MRLLVFLLLFTYTSVKCHSPAGTNDDSAVLLTNLNNDDETFGEQGGAVDLDYVVGQDDAEEKPQNSNIGSNNITRSNIAVAGIQVEISHTSDVFGDTSGTVDPDYVTDGSDVADEPQNSRQGFTPLGDSGSSIALDNALSENANEETPQNSGADSTFGDARGTVDLDYAGGEDDDEETPQNFNVDSNSDVGRGSAKDGWLNEIGHNLQRSVSGGFIEPDYAVEGNVYEKMPQHAQADLFFGIDHGTIDPDYAVGGNDDEETQYSSRHSSNAFLGGTRGTVDPDYATGNDDQPIPQSNVASSTFGDDHGTVDPDYALGGHDDEESAHNTLHNAAPGNVEPDFVTGEDHDWDQNMHSRRRRYANSNDYTHDDVDTAGGLDEIISAAEDVADSVHHGVDYHEPSHVGSEYIEEDVGGGTVDVDYRYTEDGESDYDTQGLSWDDLVAIDNVDPDLEADEIDTTDIETAAEYAAGKPRANMLTAAALQLLTGGHGSVGSSFSSGGFGTSGCKNDGLRRGVTGIIQSPRYPNDYPGNTRCHWRVKTPQGTNIRVKIHRPFYVEPNPKGDCYDKLVFTTLDGREKTFCGEAPPRSISFPANELNIDFITDREKGGAGFKLSYRARRTGRPQRPTTPQTNWQAGGKPSGWFNPQQQQNLWGGQQQPYGQTGQWRPGGSQTPWKPHNQQWRPQGGIQPRPGAGGAGIIGPGVGGMGPGAGGMGPRPGAGGMVPGAGGMGPRPGAGGMGPRPGAGGMVPGAGGMGPRPGAGGMGPRPGMGQGSGGAGAACGAPVVAPDLTGSQRIVGGQVARKCSWPWQSLLKYMGTQACGGSLINNQWILTAAHCFKGPMNNPPMWTIILGEHLENKQEGDEIQRNVKQIVVHPRYNPSAAKKHDNDLTLIQLDKPVQFTRCVRPICLPRAGPKVDDTCYVTGFGSTKGTGGSDVLKQAAVPIIPPATCNAYPKYNVRLTNNMICAGYAEGGRDSCQGDSGGPFVCQPQDNGPFILQGVVSWGLGCAKAKAPGVYANVHNYLSWIRQVTGGNF